MPIGHNLYWLRRALGAIRRSSAVTLTTAVALTASVALAAPVGVAAAHARSTRTGTRPPFPAPEVTFAGHGAGAGWGLSQWGAFGYAAAGHKTYKWILAHFYPATKFENLSPAADRRVIAVMIGENSGRPITVTSASIFTARAASSTAQAKGSTAATYRAPAGSALMAVLSRSGPSKGTWSIRRAAGCSAPADAWTPIARGLLDPVFSPASMAPGAPPGDLLQLCRAGHKVVTYRGRIEALDHDGAARTLSLVPLEQYVDDVLPSESPAGWGIFGPPGPQHERWGFQELEAQAVAVRTYVLAEIAEGGFNGYADTCDDGCQSYMAGTGDENPLSTLASLDTAGQVLELDGAPAPTQYSPSSGGYTAGSSAFAPVADGGDAVCLGGPNSLGCNPWHDWQASVPVGEIEHKLRAIGTLSSVRVVKRNGLGAGGGRVLAIEAIGTTGVTESLSGTQWAIDFGLASDWFSVTKELGGHVRARLDPTEATPGDGRLALT